MKTILSKTSLKRRLILMLAGMALLVLILALLIFTVAGVLRQQASMMAQLRGLTQVVAANAESAIVFGDSQAAGVSLSSLRERQEIVAARQVGFRPVRMGPRILRTETAGLAALAAMQALWGDFRGG